MVPRAGRRARLSERVGPHICPEPRIFSQCPRSVQGTTDCPGDNRKAAVRDKTVAAGDKTVQQTTGRPHGHGGCRTPRTHGDRPMENKCPWSLSRVPPGARGSTGLMRAWPVPRTHGDHPLVCGAPRKLGRISPRAQGARTAGTRRGRTRPDELQREQLTGRRQKGRIDTWRTGSPTGPLTRRSSWP